MPITEFNLANYELTVTEFKGYKVYKEVMGEWCAFIAKGNSWAIEYWQCENLLGVVFHTPHSTLENVELIMCRAIQDFCAHDETTIFDLTNDYSENSEHDLVVIDITSCSTTEELLDDMITWFEKLD